MSVSAPHPTPLRFACSDNPFTSLTCLPSQHIKLLPQGFCCSLVPYHKLRVIARAGERGSRARSTKGLCCMQVCDLLTACGLSPSDSLLPELLQFTTFESCEMRCLSSMVQANVKAASRELLEACVMHRDGRAWLRRDRITKERATSRCTSLISSSSTRKEQVVRRFHMLDGCHTVFELTIPSRGEQLQTHVEKSKENTMRFSVNLMRSQVLSRAALTHVNSPHGDAIMAASLNVMWSLELAGACCACGLLATAISAFKQVQAQLTCALWSCACRFNCVVMHKSCLCLCLVNCPICMHGQTSWLAFENASVCVTVNCMAAPFAKLC